MRRFGGFVPLQELSGRFKEKVLAFLRFFLLGLRRSRDRDRQQTTERTPEGTEQKIRFHG
jgi:hypothetical protein